MISRKLLPLTCCLLAAACANQPPAESGVPAAAEVTDLPAAAYLSALPDGEVKRQFIIDCTGCHTFHEGIAYPGGEPRSEESWRERATSMIERFGAASSFPVISRMRDAAATARWLSNSLPRKSEIAWTPPDRYVGVADIREYEIQAADLPHDLAVAGDRVVVTGMFSGRMYLLDPATGTVTTEATPHPNPRAIELDSLGQWWVVLGGPQKLARRSTSGVWQSFDVGFYAHSVALAPDGGAWVNGHFTHGPELIRRVDPNTGEVRTYEISSRPDFSSTEVPYEIRVAADGRVWMTELQGNRLVRVDPATGAVKTWTLPMSASGPRRFDIDPDGIVWIPEYGANKLARFDPHSERFTEYELPVRDALPYVVRYDPGRRVLWIGTGAADALFKFDPGTARFTYYRLTTPDALVRHLAIAANGDVWLAPGAAPALHATRVIRVRPLN